MTTRTTTIKIDDRGSFLGQFLFYATVHVFVDLDPDSRLGIENVGFMVARDVIVSTDENDYDIDGDIAQAAVMRWMETHRDEVIDLASAALEGGAA